MKKRNLSLIVTVLFLLTVVGSATYAYFMSTIEIGNNLTFEAMFNSVMPTFTAQVEKDINLQVYTTEMLSQSVGSSKSDNGTIIINFLSGTNDTSATCWYDIDYVWDGAVYTPTHELPIYDEEKGVTYNYELSLKGSRTTTGDDGFTYSNKNFAETNIDKLSWTDDGKTIAKLVDDAEIHNQSATIPTITTWTFEMSFYSLPTAQNSLLNQSYKGHLVISDTRC